MADEEYERESGAYSRRLIFDYLLYFCFFIVILLTTTHFNVSPFGYCFFLGSAAMFRTYRTGYQDAKDYFTKHKKLDELQ